jgi:hypothetical protein
MNHNPLNPSPLDRIPFAIRVLIAGALTLSTLFLSVAAGLMLLAYAAGATPGRQPVLARPARVVAGAVESRVEDSLARFRGAVGIGGREPCPLIADDPGRELPHRLVLRTLVRHTFE